MEWHFHTEIYKRRSDVNAVVHAHSPYSTGLAIAGVEIRPITLEAALMLAKVPVVPFKYPGTKELAEELASLKEISNGKEENLVFLKDEQLKTARAKARPGIKFREAFNAAKKRAGLPDIHMHDLRHTAASHLIMSGVDIRTLADILGHRTLQMVQRYTHLLHDHKLTAIDKIGSLGRGKD